MALTEETGNGFYMPVAPAYGVGGNGGFGNAFGGDWAWIILLLLLGWGNNGWGGNGAGGYANGGVLYPWMNQAEVTNNGFQNIMLNDNITSIRDGVNGIATQLCNGFADIEQGANARQIANMQTAFAGQTAMSQGFNAVQSQLAQCCCDNRLATAQTQAIIQSEACANRATSTANTQAILDKLCQLELDNYKTQIEAKNDTISQLRADLSFARGQASQDVQTAEIRANNALVANQLVSELRSCPIPAQPVYGNTPIFTCGGSCSCNA